MAKNHCTGTVKLGINHCCEGHDVAYECQITTRKEADESFRQCIIAHGDVTNKKLAYSIVGWIYYAGVRALGWPFWAYGAWKLRKDKKSV